MFIFLPSIAAAMTALVLSPAGGVQCPGPFNCFVPHANPSCDDQTCCTAVCAIDALCCWASWDAMCVDLANDNCEQPPVAGPFVSPFNGDSYYLLPPTASWTEAQMVAEKDYGGNLATILSDEENAWVYNQVLAHDGNFARRGWIGYYSPSADETYVWVSGVQGGYSNWYVGEPNLIGIENYTEMIANLDGRWANNYNKAFDGPNWAIVQVPAPKPCVADLNNDGVVDGADLGLLLAAWGPCNQP
jgi:hypothetical protein